MFSSLAYIFVLSLASILVILAAVSDARSFRIPNWIVLALLALFPLHVLLSPTPVLWQRNLIVFIGAFGIGYIGYLKNLAGAGDIKLLATILLWAGLAFAAECLFVTAIAGGVLAAGLVGMTYIRQRLAGQKQTTAMASSPVPYGIAIALGGLCTLANLFHPDLLSGKV